MILMKKKKEKKYKCKVCLDKKEVSILSEIEECCQFAYRDGFCCGNTISKLEEITSECECNVD